ncbi:hypothetical protein RI054_24g102020 [Pseudoscourfieldia marina]
MAKGGGEPTVGSNKGSNKVKYKPNLVLKLFGGIATDDEVKCSSRRAARRTQRARTWALDSCSQEAQRACGGVSRDAYIDAKCPVPPRSTDQPTQTEGELGGLSPWRSQETQRVAVDLDKSTLRAWRSKHDAKKRGHR